MRRPSTRSRFKATGGSRPPPSAPTSEPGPDGRLDPFQIDEGVQGAFCHRPVPGRPHRPCGRTADRHRRRKPGHQPHRVRGQQAGQGRAAQARNPIEGARDAVSRPWCRRTSRASSRSTAAADASTFASNRRSSSLPTAASISSSKSPKAPRPGSGTIDFVGNRAYSSYRLKDVIKTSTTGLLAFLQTGDIYDPDRLEADRELLRRFYLKHGYIDVRIVSAIGEYDPALQRFRDHLHDRGGRAVSRRNGRRSVEHARARSGIAALGGCGPIRAMSTTPRRSRSPSRT